MFRKIFSYSFQTLWPPLAPWSKTQVVATAMHSSDDIALPNRFLVIYYSSPSTAPSSPSPVATPRSPSFLPVRKPLPGRSSRSLVQYYLWFRSPTVCVVARSCVQLSQPAAAVFNNRFYLAFLPTVFSSPARRVIRSPFGACVRLLTRRFSPFSIFIAEPCFFLLFYFRTPLLTERTIQDGVRKNCKSLKTTNARRHCRRRVCVTTNVERDKLTNYVSVKTNIM